MPVSSFVFRCLVAAGLAIAPLRAVPILYIETGELSGVLGSTALRNTPFEFDFYANTADLAGVGLTFDPYADPVQVNTVKIGSWTGTFTAPLTMELVNSPGIIGFFDASGYDGIDFAAAGLANYRLSTAISVAGASAQYAAGWLPTDTGGKLGITGAQDLTFTAITSVPEAGGFVYCAIGLVFVLLYLRSLRRRPFRIPHGAD
jgi:hypothetical protein